MTPAIVANPWELGQTLFDYGRQFQASLPWTPEELLATLVQHWRMLVGPHAPFDTARWQALQETVDRRTQNAVAAFNHVAAVTVSPPWAERLPAIACPTLVIPTAAPIPTCHRCMASNWQQASPARRCARSPAWATSFRLNGRKQSPK